MLETEGAIAGATAGVVVETALYPIDTIKTRLQVNNAPCHIYLNYSILGSGLCPSGGLLVTEGIHSNDLHGFSMQKITLSVVFCAPSNFSLLSSLEDHEGIVSH